MRKLYLFSLAVLLSTIGVILWGAYVRVSGSGAGCGSHWPMCNGAVLPNIERRETWVELLHRATSGFAYVLVALQTVWALRIRPKRRWLRRSAALGLVFMTTEALVGAGLVLFELVADNDSMARAAWMSAHLTNTFLLLSALTFTAFFARHGEPTEHELPRRRASMLGLAWLLTLVLGVSGAVTALGDTLFPSESLLGGLRADFSPTAHLLTRLRVVHPLIGLAVGSCLLGVSAYCSARTQRRLVKRLALSLVVAFVAQVGIGFVNLALLAPTWSQLVHLLMADGVWIALNLLTVAVLHAPEPAAAPASFPANAQSTHA